MPSLSLSLRLVSSLCLLAFAAARLLSLPALLMLHSLALLALRSLTCGLLALAAAFATLGLALAVLLLCILPRLTAATLRGLLVLLSG
jgi:hypothetical protein